MKKLHLALIIAAAAYATLAPIGGAELLARVHDDRPGIMVGPAFVESAKITVTTTATAILPPSGRTMVGYTCQNTSTTKLAVGSSNIGDPTSAQSSPVYCSTNCPDQTFGGDVRQEYALADTGTVDIFCRFMVAASTAP